MLPYHGQAPHPGDMLNKLLERTLSISKLARALGLPTRRVSSIVDGATLNADEAKRLGSYFGTPASYWIGLGESDHDKARRRAK